SDRSGVQRFCEDTDSTRLFGCKIAKRKQIVVPRERVGCWNADPGEVVVHIMPQKTGPRFVKFLLWISAAALKPIRHDCGRFGSRALQLALAVIAFEFAMGSIAPCAE